MTHLPDEELREAIATILMSEFSMPIEQEAVPVSIIESYRNSPGEES